MPPRPVTHLPESAPPAVVLGIASRSMTVGAPEIGIAADGSRHQTIALNDWACRFAQANGSPCAHCRPRTPKAAVPYSGGLLAGVPTTFLLRLYDMGGAWRIVPPGLLAGSYRTTVANFQATLEDACVMPLSAASRRNRLDRRKVRRWLRRLFDEFDAAYQPRATRWMAMDGVQPVGTTYTNILDVESGAVLDVLPAYDGPTIIAWLKTLPNRDVIRVFAIDPSAMERRAIRDGLAGRNGPVVVILLDHRHVIALLLKGMHEVRIACGLTGQRERLTENGRKVDRLKALMERSGRELDDDQRVWLLKMLDREPMLRRAWECKEEFLATVMTAISPKMAAERFARWQARIPNDVRGYFATFVNTIGSEWRHEFTASFGPARFGTNQVESLNRRLKEITRDLNGGHHHQAIRARMLFRYGTPQARRLIHDLIAQITAEVAAIDFTPSRKKD